jgi:hypothetical protein
MGMTYWFSYCYIINSLYDILHEDRHVIKQRTKACLSCIAHVYNKLISSFYDFIIISVQSNQRINSWSPPSVAKL